MGLLEQIEACMDCTEPTRKVELVSALARRWRGGAADAGELATGAPRPIRAPGRPGRLQLVAPNRLPRRRLGSVEGRAALYHAVAHIEYNAIHLGLDAVYRFRGQPRAFYDDWMRVADDEARHFMLLEGRLHDLGHRYGDFPAHNGLWDMAEQTAHDVLVRMALVPRVLEARGLDVTPGMIQRLGEVGDQAGVRILEQILEEEVPHVAIGSRWFRHFCDQRGLPPESTFRRLVGEYMRGRLKGPFNVDARLQAGFSRAELEALEALAP